MKYEVDLVKKQIVVTNYESKWRKYLDALQKVFTPKGYTIIRKLEDLPYIEPINTYRSPGTTAASGYVTVTTGSTTTGNIIDWSSKEMMELIDSTGNMVINSKA